MSEIITESNQTVSQEDNSTQNDYIIAINKKIRAQKKKCQNIAYIEQRLANKETINSDQKKVIESKDQTVKMLKELESLRNQFVEIYNAEEKKKAEKRASSSFVVPVPAPVPVVTVPDQSVIETKVSEVVRDLIALFHTTQVFDKTRPDGAEARQRLFAEIDGKSQVIKGEDDIDYIYYLLSWLFTNSINNATAIANKFLVGVEEEWDQGVTYKQLKDVVSELVASQTFLSHPVQVNYQQQEQVQPQEAPIQHEEPQQVVAPTEAPVEVKQPQQEEPQTPQEQPQVEENVPEEPQQQDPSKDDDGYTTKEGRFSRGRGRGGRGTRGGGRGSPRGGRYFDGNRGGRGGDRGKDFEHRSPREFNDRPRGGRGSPRGGRDFDGNRGGRGQPQQPKA